jgi:ATP-dependent helicase/DNAse subunit B
VNKKRIISRNNIPDLQVKLIEDIKSYKDKYPLKPLHIVVRSNLVKTYLERLITRETKGIVNVKIFNLLELVKYLLQRFDWEEKKYASRLILKIYLVELIEKEFSQFSNFSDKRGLAESIINSFIDLREGGVLNTQSFQEIRNIVNDCKNLSDNYKSIFEIFKKLNDFILKENLFTDEDYFYKATEFIEEYFSINKDKKDNDAVKLHEIDELLIYGYYDFNHIQQKFLEEVFTNFDIHYYFPIPLISEREVGEYFKFAQHTLDWLLDRGFIVDSVDEQSETKENLSRLKLLITQNSDINLMDTDKDDSLTIISTPNPRNEIEEIIRRIVSISGEGVPLYEMAIVILGGDVQRKMVEDILSEYGIPFYSKGLPLKQQRTAKGLLFFVNTLLNDFLQEDVLNFLSSLNSTYLYHNNYDEIELVDKFRELTYSLNIVGGYENWLSSIEYFLNNVTASESELGGFLDIKNFVEVVFDILKDIRSKFPELNRRENPEYLVSILKRFIEEYLDTDNNKELVYDILSKFENLADYINSIEFADFLNNLTGEIDEKNVNLKKFQKSGINILDKNQIRGMAFNTIFIPQFQEGIFPSSLKRDPFLDDNLRMTINSKTDKRIVILKDGTKEDKLLFGNLILSSKEKLSISYSRFQLLNSKDEFPSHYILEIAGKLYNKLVDYEELTDKSELTFFDYILKDNKKPTISLIEFDGKMIDSLKKDYSIASAKEYFLQNALYSSEKNLRKLSQNIQNIKNKNLWGIIVNDEILQKFRNWFNQREHSVTGIEQYSNCPLRYFYNYVLSLSTTSPPERYFTISPLQKGSIVHNVLHRYFSEFKEKNRKFSLRELDNNIEKISKDVSDEINKLFINPPEEYLPVIKAEKKNISISIQEAINKDKEAYGDFRPEYFEAMFGYTKGRGDVITREPVTIVFNDGSSINIRGKVDRIDFGDGILRIIDYKSGSSVISQNKIDSMFETGDILQLPLYLYIYNLINDDEYPEFLLQYFYLKKNRFVSIYKDKTLYDLIDKVNEILCKLTNSINKGIFIPYINDRTCDYCDFRIICDTETVKPLYNYNDIPGAEEFYSLKGDDTNA